jgi:hypothetical protein
MRSPLLLGPALVVALTLSSLARADISPPAGFVESCTLKAQSGAGKECLSCAAFYGNSNHCEESLASYGFAQGCRTGGASVWSEVWCRAAGPKAVPVPKDVLAQLDKAAGRPPAPAMPSAAPTGSLPIDPVSPAFVAPTAPPSAAPPPPPPMPTGTPLADPPAPPPMPPTGGCGGCATPRPETAIWAPMLALGALAVGWSRRRNRR